MRTYLAGPMSGKPYFNFPAFFEGEVKLKAMGHEVFNPAGNDVKVYGDFWKQCPNGTHEEAALARPGDPPTYRDCLRTDLNWILDHAEAIAFLPGWENSKGAKIERALAEVLGLPEVKIA